MDWLRLGIVLGVLLVALLIEMEFQAIQEWFTQRPLQAGIVSGALLAFVVAAGLDALRAQMASRRWDPLVRLAFLAIAYQTTVLIDTFLWLLSAKCPKNDAKPERSAHWSLIRIRRQSGLQLPTDDDLGDIKHAQLLTMLTALIRSPDWRDFAVDALDHAKFRHRDGLAVWVAAMLSTGESADVLKRSADINEWVSHIQDQLRRLDPSARDGLYDKAIRSILDWLVEAFSFREDLHVVARGALSPDMKGIRERTLSADECAKIEQREHDTTSPRKRLVQPHRTSSKVA